MAKSYSSSAIFKHLKAGTECACLAVFETCQGRVDHAACKQSADLHYGGSANMAISNFQLVCAVAVVAIATFINLPAPRFSKRLEQWRIMGQYFNYKGNAIFYQGEVQ